MTSVMTEKSVPINMNFPYNSLRNAYDNYEIQQELKKHCSQAHKPKAISGTKARIQQEKMNEMYQKICLKNFQINEVKHDLKRLDKRILHLFEKSKRLKLILSNVESENTDLELAILALVSSKF